MGVLAIGFQGFSPLLRDLPFSSVAVVEVTPPRPGEHDFRCQMGMLRGRLVAE